MPQHQLTPPLCCHRWRKVKVKANLISGYHPIHRCGTEEPTASQVSQQCLHYFRTRVSDVQRLFYGYTKTCQTRSNTNGTSAQSSNVNVSYPFMCRTKKSGAPTPHQIACQTLKCAGRGSRLLMTSYARRRTQIHEGKKSLSCGKKSCSSYCKQWCVFFKC